jgi:spore coat polysaccharide biosynthesis protein SpsF
MKFDIITQVRYTSTRLPGKVLLNFGKTCFLNFFISNLKKIKGINSIIVACPDDKFIKIFRSISYELGVKLFAYKGSENNVLDRYYACSKKFSCENIIRVTSDTPIINIFIIKDMINFYKKKKLSFLSNNKPRFIPHGFDCEIFHHSILNKAKLHAKTKYEKEHVTPWMYKNCFTKKNTIKIIKKNYSDIRITIDTPKDYLFFKKNEKILKKIATTKNYESYLGQLKNEY